VSICKHIKQVTKVGYESIGATTNHVTIGDTREV